MEALAIAKTTKPSVKPALFKKAALVKDWTGMKAPHSDKQARTSSCSSWRSSASTKASMAGSVWQSEH